MITSSNKSFLITSCPIAATVDDAFNGLRNSKFMTMLFIPSDPTMMSWQMNTLGMKTEIDMLFFDERHRLVKCWNTVPPNVTLFPVEAYMVLELPGGTCTRMGMNVQNNMRIAVQLAT